MGRKTANVVLNVAFGEPTMAVDTHVFRVANRTGLARGANPRAVEDELLRVIPAEFLQHAHHWLILLGRYICKARAPAVPASARSALVRIPRQDRGLSRYSMRVSPLPNRLEIMRAMTLSASTNSVISNAPVQASDCQFL